jgi:hypothetical protein
MVDVLQTLVSAVVGGFLVLAGQLVLEDRKQASERKIRRSEKLEQLVALSYEHLVASERKDAENMVLLHAKIEALTVVHFADFSENVQQVAKHAVEWYTSRLSDNADGAAYARKAYLNAHHAFIENIKQYARREVQPDKSVEPSTSGVSGALSHLPGRAFKTVEAFVLKAFRA